MRDSAEVSRVLDAAIREQSRRERIERRVRIRVLLLMVGLSALYALGTVVGVIAKPADSSVAMNVLTVGLAIGIWLVILQPGAWRPLRIAAGLASFLAILSVMLAPMKLGLPRTMVVFGVLEALLLAICVQLIIRSRSQLREAQALLNGDRSETE